MVILPETSVGHREGGRTGTVLGLDDLVTAELDAVDESIVLVVGNGRRGLDLAEEGNDGLARVTANDGDGQVLGLLLASEASNEGLSADNVEGGDTEETLGVEDVLGLEDLSGDRDGGVDGVRDDEDEGLGGDLSSNLDKTLDDTGIDIEQIITGHTGLA